MRLALLLAALSLPFPLVGQDLYAGLIGCYSFSGNADDASGHHNNGVVNGAVSVSDRFGNPGSAYHFNGTSDYVALPADSFSTPSYSYSVWIALPPSIPFMATAAIISVGDNAGQGQSIFLVNAGTDGRAGDVTLSASSSAVTSPARPVIAAGKSISVHTGLQWHHIAITQSVATGLFNFYVDGDVVSKMSLSSNSPYYGKNTTATIGTGSGLTHYFGGPIDDVAIYDRALSDAEVALLFRKGLPCVPEYPPTVNSVVLCGSGSAVLTASGGTAYRWFDDARNGTLLFEGNPFVIPDLAITTYYYVAKVTDNAGSSRAQATVTVLPPLQLVCPADAEFPTGISQAFVVSLQNGHAPLEYRFNFGDGAGAIAAQGSSEHSYQQAGNYSFSCSSTDHLGCVAECTSAITVFDVFIPSVISANFDPRNDRLTLFKSKDGDLVPYTGSIAFSLKILNRWGKEVFQTQDSLKGWPDEAAAEGIYWYEITFGERRFRGWVAVIK